MLDELIKGNQPAGTIVLADAHEVEHYNSAPIYNGKYIFDTPIISDGDPSFDLMCEQVHTELQQVWRYPDIFEELDILDAVIDEDSTEEEIARLKMEYEYFLSIDAIPMIKYIMYILHTCVQENVVWGIGRGSSVSSYLLFKLGVHAVDSIKYDLDFSEFARQTPTT